MIKLNRQRLRQFRYFLRHDILRRENLLVAGIVIGAVMLLSASVRAISQNYQQQKRLDTKLREAKILELQTENLAYEQAYFASQEYQDLALRRQTNLVLPGETMVILPEYSNWVRDKEAELNKQFQSTPRPAQSNLRQWIDFFFGAKSAQFHTR